MSGTSLVLLTLYSVFNIVAPGRTISPEIAPYLLGLLVLASALTCLAAIGLNTPPNRTAAKGARLHKVRRITGPRDRRV